MEVTVERGVEGGRGIGGRGIDGGGIDGRESPGRETGGRAISNASPSKSLVLIDRGGSSHATSQYQNGLLASTHQRILADGARLLTPLHLGIPLSRASTLPHHLALSLPL